MDCFKLFDIIGISLQIVGVLILAKSDALSRRIESAYQSILGNPLIDAYEAKKKGEERIISKEEQNYMILEASADAHKALHTFKISLLLVILGMVIQLVIEILKP